MHKLRRLWDTGPRWLLWSAPFILTFVLYRRILLLPLYWDDAPHYFFVVPNTLRQIWTNQTGYAYYRPLIFTFYKLAFQLFVPNWIYFCLRGLPGAPCAQQPSRGTAGRSPGP